MKVVIIGAGLAGLAAATWLSKTGHEVEIYEKTEAVGGRAKTIKRSNSNDIVDVGTQYFHSSYKRTLKLIKEVELTNHLHKIKGKTRFFDTRVKGDSFTTGHRLPYISAGSALQNVKLILSGLCRIITNPINPYSVLETSKIDDITLQDAVSDQFEWEFNVRTLFAAGGLIEPDNTNVSYLHLIRLMRIILTTDYLSLDGGIALLHEKLAQGVKIHYGISIEQLVLSEDKITGCITETGEHIKTDHIIVATPPATASKLLPKNWHNEAMFLNSIKQPKAITATLFLNQPLETNVWSYVFRPNPERIVSFCVDASQKNPNMVPSNKAALQAWICHPAAQRVYKMNDAELLDTIVDELRPNFPNLKDTLDEAYIHRVEHAIPQMSVGHNARAHSFLKQIDNYIGIDFCGDYLSGGYMECALWSVERAIGKIEKMPN